ncbi:hypothetical protein BDN70DRAFT_879654 [Pholiota conissans]|uniref:Uncharacterized protein n=1 Tax=Pholiota conissans TaxID=109636 RepID=A0A9P5YZN4_9AGAR|nr:hypothetical protein BDN70DRAFT_879654 [Pholiota conissans]
MSSLLYSTGTYNGASLNEAPSTVALSNVASPDSSTPIMPSVVSVTHIILQDTLVQLPSYEEVTSTRDVARLPGYRRARPQRYHPYRVNYPVLADGVGIDRLFNTIYDEEYICIHVPPAPLRPLPTPPLVPTPLPLPVGNPNPNEVEDFFDYRADDYPPQLAEFDRHVAQNVAAVILQEFVAAPSWGGRRTGNPQPALPS